MRLLAFLSLVGCAHAIVRGINLFGLETENRDFMCSWVHGIEHYVNILDGMGFNSFRIPFSYQYVREADFSKMDKLFDSVKDRNITILLDFHRINNMAQSPTPTDGITEQDYWNAWHTMADRYKDRPELVGLDLFNEYQGRNVTYWNDMMERTMLTMEENFPGRFRYYVGGTNWGGSLAGINLEHLPFRDRIYYIIHKYIFSGNSVPSDWDISFPNQKHIPAERIAVGEWGFRTADEGEDQMWWAKMFVDYLWTKNVTSTYFWCMSQSGDTKSLFYDNCLDVNWTKYNFIRHHMWKDVIYRKHLRGSPEL